MHVLSYLRMEIDPDRMAAIHACEWVGFRRVGIMRKYERGPDGVWHDGLMDMLKEEFHP
jgi:aminoglycoside 6'-N-acetyltransferase